MSILTVFLISRFPSFHGISPTEAEEVLGHDQATIFSHPLSNLGGTDSGPDPEM